MRNIWTFIVCIICCLGKVQGQSVEVVPIRNLSFEEGNAYWNFSEVKHEKTVQYTYCSESYQNRTIVCSLEEATYTIAHAYISPEGGHHGNNVFRAIRLAECPDETIVILSQKLDGNLKPNMHSGLSFFYKLKKALPFTIYPSPLDSESYTVQAQPEPSVSIYLGTSDNPTAQPLKSLNASDDWSQILMDIQSDQNYDYLTFVVERGEFVLDEFWQYPIPCIGDPSFESLGGAVTGLPSMWQKPTPSGIEVKDSHKNISPSDGSRMLLMTSKKEQQCIYEPMPEEPEMGMCATSDLVFTNAYIEQDFEFEAEEELTIAFDWMMTTVDESTSAQSSLLYLEGFDPNTSSWKKIADLVRPAQFNTWRQARAYVSALNTSYTKIRIVLAVEDDIVLNCGGRGLESACNSINPVSISTSLLVDNFQVTKPSVGFNFQVPCFPNDVTFSSTSSMENGCILRNEWDFTTDGIYDQSFSKTGQCDVAEPQMAKASFAFPAPGTYTVTLKSTSSCLSTSTVSKEVVVGGFEEQAHTWTQKWDEMSEVLGVSTATFAQARIVDLSGYGAELRDANPYDNGQLGVWKPDASYAYVEERSGWSLQDPHADVNLSKDGTFPYRTFNPLNAPLKMADGWKKVADITHYNALGAEVENKDILGIYSAALFDQRGQLSTAVGANTKYYEMGYAGFEAYEGDINTADYGHFNLFQKEVSRIRFLEMKAANKNIATIVWPYNRIHELVDVAFTAKGKTVIGTSLGKEFILQQLRLDTCHSPHPTNPDLSIVRLNDPTLIDKGVWLGQLAWYEKKQTSNVVSAYSISNKKAHTGKYSLRAEAMVSPDGIRTGQPPKIEQYTLRLEPGKRYVISAWVSIGNKTDDQLSRDTLLAEDIGIVVSFGTNAKRYAPSGPIIEGWQRIEAEFVVPESGQFALAFHPGKAIVAYFDDLRLFPFNGNMVSYVYEPNTYRLMATLDNNNFASLYFYDREGNLQITKKETIEGIKTIQEVRSSMPSTAPLKK